MSSLAESARETLLAIARGAYTAPSGRSVAIADAVEAALRGTVTHSPEETLAAARADFSTRIELTAEAGRRLVEREQIGDVVALNFASAKTPGGGFLGGAKAQEEDLARASALHPCLEGQLSPWPLRTAIAR